MATRTTLQTRQCSAQSFHPRWIEREVETFVARGFTPVSLGGAILRVEAAVASAFAQLELLARLTAR